MKRESQYLKKLSILFVLATVLFAGCSKDDFETGIEGKVIYGEGDCMPIINLEDRVYSSYNGNLFFIVKGDLDSLGNGDFDQLKNNSISLSIKRGKLSAELPVGTYLVMPEEVYVYSEENTITITSGGILSKDLKFWKCTSY